MAILGLLAGVLLCGCSRQAAQAGLTPAARVAQGWNQFSMGEYSLAAKRFETAAAEAVADDALRAQAVYGLAVTAWLRQPDPELPKAEALFRELAAGNNADYAAWSALCLVRIKHLVPGDATPDYLSLHKAYMAVYEKYPQHAAGEEAFLYAQAVRVVKQDKAEAATVVQDIDAFIGTHPKSGFLSGLYSLKSSCHTLLEQPEARLAADIRSLECRIADSGDPWRDNAASYWSIATVAEFEAGDFTTARTYYRKLLTEYDNDLRGFAAQEALARMDAVEAKLRGSGKASGDR